MKPSIDRIRELSLEAYNLALAYAEARGSVPSGIDDLRAAIAAVSSAAGSLAGHDAPSARIAISEALIDLDWIESEGRLATSVRLALHLASMGKQV